MLAELSVITSVNHTEHIQQVFAISKPSVNTDK